MSDAVNSSLGVVAYLALFAAVGVLFLLVNLLVGKLIRPGNPQAEKSETYECGEPAVGSSFVQFDLRFYVVALLFIIFDVEIAFFFPWATVFGKATHLADTRSVNRVVELKDGEVVLTDQATAIYRELGIRAPRVPDASAARLGNAHGGALSSELDRSAAVIRRSARQLALVTVLDIVIFFAVLLVGFAYVWRRGDLDWVRAYRAAPPGADGSERSQGDMDLEQALSA